MNNDLTARSETPGRTIIIYVNNGSRIWMVIVSFIHNSG